MIQLLLYGDIKMSGSVNKVTLVGNLGRDPEVRAMQNGDKIVQLSIATSDRWKDKSSGEQRERTEWHRVVIFNDALGKIAEQYLKKGSTVYLEGQLQTRKWTDQEGVEKYTTEVVIQSFKGELTLLGNRNEGSSFDNNSNNEAFENNSNQNKNPPLLKDDIGLDDDIPF